MTSVLSTLHRQFRVRLIPALALAGVVAAVAGLRVQAADAVAQPTVTGPIQGGTHGRPFGALDAADLTASRFTEAEYFFSGSATSYDKEGTWGVDGIWNVKPSRTAPYKVRMLVRRPADPHASGWTRQCCRQADLILLAAPAGSAAKPWPNGVTEAALARDLRILVRERLQAGDSDEQVRAFLVQRYGDFILLKPPLKLETLLLWGAPLLVLIAGAGVIFVSARRRRLHAATALSESERAKLATLLGEVRALAVDLTELVVALMDRLARRGAEPDRTPPLARPTSVPTNGWSRSFTSGIWLTLARWTEPGGASSPTSSPASPTEPGLSPSSGSRAPRRPRPRHPRQHEHRAHRLHRPGRHRVVPLLGHLRLLVAGQQRLVLRLALRR